MHSYAFAGKEQEHVEIHLHQDMFSASTREKLPIQKERRKKVEREESNRIQ